MEYASVDAGGMMSGHWFPPRSPCFTAHLFYAVGAQHGGIAGLGELFRFMLNVWQNHHFKVLSMQLPC